MKKNSNKKPSVHIHGFAMADFIKWPRLLDFHKIVFGENGYDRIVGAEKIYSKLQMHSKMVCSGQFNCSCDRFLNAISPFDMIASAPIFRLANMKKYSFFFNHFIAIFHRYVCSTSATKFFPHSHFVCTQRLKININ